MTNQYKSYLVKSFVKGIRDELERPSYSSLNKKSASIEPYRRRSDVYSTVQVKRQSLSNSQKLILPQFAIQKRKSFIDVYNQSIIKRSEDKKVRQNEIQKSNEYLKYKVMMRKRLLNKSKFRVEGLPTVFKDKKDVIQMWNQRRNQTGIKTCADQSMRTVQYPGENIQNKKDKLKRCLTDENFIMEPWGQMDSYYKQ